MSDILGSYLRRVIKMLSYGNVIDVKHPTVRTKSGRFVAGGGKGVHRAITKSCNVAGLHVDFF